MIDSNDRKLQLETYSELIQPVKRKKPIDIDMEIEFFFKNLKVKIEERHANKPMYYDGVSDEFCFEYGDLSLGGHLWASRKVKIMFENLGITEKKSIWYVKRMMNRHHNISRVKHFAYYTNW